MQYKELICLAAVRIKDGRLFVGTRHDECFKQILKCNGDEDFKLRLGHIAGFVTNKCKFLNREEAYEFATNTGQLLQKELIGSILTSEDLW